MAKPPKQQQPEEKNSSIGASSRLQSILNHKDHKDDHFNFEEAVTWKISTGSLLLDAAVGGGITPSLIRLCGPNNENMLGVIFLNADGLSDCLQLKMPILESEIYSKSIFSNEAFGAKVSGFKKRRISPVANFAPQLHP